MKTLAPGTEIEIKIEPHGYSMKYYCIYFRVKKKFNLFNSWNRLVRVWDGDSLHYDQPVLISNFDDAVKYGTQFVNNPNLINEHYDREDKKYYDAIKRRNDYYISRNKTAII